jgi:hypothetical protein
MRQTQVLWTNQNCYISLYNVTEGKGEHLITTAQLRCLHM